ncbi:formylglycine-generating enzyme family protein [Lamprocystis purpurea]|jgi:formylglycine-generating enzyme required for sulfatase activity|uniref:formylglycine-generating enzyme family protein n=1 Tax=Lamprocystis purpurea TaxID=61598 RepID=UPI00036C59FD|nr:formylglycine-generating enzyme family protein [Lamprocystis purpurea]
MKGPPPGPPPEQFPACWAGDWGEDPFGLWQSLIYRGVRQAFRWIPPTAEPFLMGSPESEHEHRSDERQHPVLLTRGFWLAETACTQALWTAVMGGNPSGFKGERRPVENVSWDDVQGFIDRLNAELAAFPGRVSAQPGAVAEGRSAQRTLRLPTEAEWEYACRAGTTGPFSCGDDITPEQANYDGNFPYRGNRKGLYRQETIEVASLLPNPWGLYEMHGNVREWCRDWYGDYPSGLVTDPVGPDSGEGRVLRGGSWLYEALYLRSASRYRLGPGHRVLHYGFRLALGPEPGQPGE